MLDPTQWPVDFPTCGGEQQSPINLDPLTAVEFDYPTFSFANYDKAFVEVVTNNGHTSIGYTDKEMISEQ